MADEAAKLQRRIHGLREMVAGLYERVASFEDSSCKLQGQFSELRSMVAGLTVRVEAGEKEDRAIQDDMEGRCVVLIKLIESIEKELSNQLATGKKWREGG